VTTIKHLTQVSKKYFWHNFLSGLVHVIPDSVPCQKPPHDGGQRDTARSEQKVEVVGSQRPSVASRLAPAQYLSQTRKEIVSIPVTEKDLLPSNSTTDDVM
jgi:hypothetical protein